MENKSLIKKLKLIRKLNAGLWGWPNEKVQLKKAEGFEVNELSLVAYFDQQGY